LRLPLRELIGQLDQFYYRRAAAQVKAIVPSGENSVSHNPLREKGKPA